MEQDNVVKQESGNQNPGNGMIMKIVLLVAMVVAFVLIMVKSGGFSSSTDCVIVPQAAFGQSERQVWTELQGSAAAQAVATFGMEEPEPAFSYDKKVYRVFTKQIYEIRYYDEANTELMRVAKGKMCGSPVYNVNEDYACRNTVDVAGLEVTEYGKDLETVAIASWTEGDFSYFIGTWNQNLSKADFEVLVQQVK